MGKLQNEDFKTEAELLAASPAGTKSQLLNDTKVYLTALGLNKRLDEAITAGDLSGGSALPEPAIFKDVLPNNSFGRNSTSGSFLTRVLNTTEGNTSFSSLSSNQITLSNAGSYFILARVNAYRPGSHVSLLYNVTDASNEIIGNDVFAATADQTETASFIVGSFTIASSKDFEIRSRVSATITGGFGVGAGFGVDEVYTTVAIWEL